MADSEHKAPMSPAEVFRIEAEAERQRGTMIAESNDRLANRCPDCGALGSLEDHGGELRCIDCDLVVGAVTRLAGFGRR